MNDEERRDRIRQEAANVHEAATYSSETQFEYAKRWRSVDRWVGSIAAGLAAVAGVGGLSKILSFEWAGIIAILSALIGAISASIAARQTTEKASGSANLYRALQQDARIFLRIDVDDLSVDEARDVLQKLVDRLQQLNRGAVIPSARTWRRAKKQIEAGAQIYETEQAWPGRQSRFRA
jgi:uncharacterized protein YhaN